MCMSYTLSCDLPQNEMSILSHIDEMCVQLATLLEASLFDMHHWVHGEKLVLYCSYNIWEDIYVVF